MYSKMVLATLVSASLLVGCEKKEQVIPEPESRPAKMFTVSVGDHASHRTFPVIVEAGDKAVLAFRVPGQLASLSVHAGELVKKGQELAALNPDEYSLLKKQAQANYELAEVQFNRIAKLRKDKVVSEQDFDSAKASLTEARAALDQASANLSYTKLQAPYDGAISIISFENFEYVGAKQDVMHIQTNQVLNAVFQLPDHLLQRFSYGEDIDAQVTFDAFPKRSFPVEFQEIDTEANPNTNSYKVTTVMSRPSDLGVLPGMSGQIKLTIPKGQSGRLPKAALIEQNGEIWVWRVAEQGTIEKVKVTLNEKRQVIDGLQDGDQIISSGVTDLVEGMKVREWIKERGL